MHDTADRADKKPDDDLSKHVDVCRHLHTRAGYRITLAVKKSAMADESEIAYTTNSPNIHIALDEAYDEAGLQGYPIIVGVMSVQQLPYNGQPTTKDRANEKAT